MLKNQYLIKQQKYNYKNENQSLSCLTDEYLCKTQRLYILKNPDLLYPDQLGDFVDFTKIVQIYPDGNFYQPFEFIKFPPSVPALFFLSCQRG